ADAVEDGLLELVPGHDPGLAESPLNAEVARLDVPVHLVDHVEQQPGLAVGDQLPVEEGAGDVAGLVAVDLQTDELGPVVEVDPVVPVLGPAAAADRLEVLGGDLDARLADAEGDAPLEAVGVDPPGAAALGGRNGTGAAPGADGGGGDSGDVGGGGGVNHDRLRFQRGSSTPLLWGYPHNI